MKTSKTLAAIVVLIAFATFAVATEKPKMNIQSINPDQVLVTFQNACKTDLEVSIFDGDDNIVYYKMSSKPIDSFNKIFDVKNLENGEYAMEVELNGLTLKRNFEVTSDKIYVGIQENYSTPHFDFQDDRLVINHLNFENKKYSLNIYDENGLIYQRKLAKESPMHSGFDLSNLKPGNYKVELNAGSNQFAYSFTRQ